MSETPQPVPVKLAYTIDEAGLAIGISPRTLYRLMSTGKIQARKAGSKTLILATELAAYLTGLPVADLRSAM